MAGMSKFDLAQSLIDTMIGLQESEAEALAKGAGLTYLVTSRDGQRFLHTTDYKQSRINLTVVDGKVTRATVG